MLQHEPLQLQADVTYVERPVQILDTMEVVLRTKTIQWVKVQWENYGPEEAMWELKDQMQQVYPYLFSDEVCLGIWGTKCSFYL